jgi:hypothetical protein
MSHFGIDVSHWQGSFDFKSAISNESVEFAILKAGGSDSNHYKDSKFNSYYETCKQLNLPVGAYYFGKDFTVSQAEASASHFISLLSGKSFELPVYYDVEADMVTKSTKSTLTSIVKAFCDKVAEAGYVVGIYANRDTFNNKLNDSQLSSYSHWVADWGSSLPKLTSKNNIDIWQFGGETNKIRSNKINNQVVDQDYCYLDLSSSSNSPVSEVQSSIPTLASCTPNLKKGSKGTQVKYLQEDLNYVMSSKLTVDGIFGNNTYTALRLFQSKMNLVVDGIYGSKSYQAMQTALK